MSEQDPRSDRAPVAPSDQPVNPTLKLDASSRQMVGRTVGGFEIRSELGRGGMAVVYKAYDRSLDRMVAVKILPDRLVQEDEEYATRFEREARAAAKLDHPNIVQIYSAGRDGGTFFIAMQFVQGSPLCEVLRQRRVGLREALELTQQAAQGLDAAHKAGIVHRDIKPSNLMLDGDGRVKVMDFGLARASLVGSGITQAGTYLGTPEYSSPEQCETCNVDGRSDIYSLGVVLYEMLAGTLPHVAETPLALFKKITEERPIPIEELNRAVPRSVRKLLAHMLAKSRDDRFQTAGEVAAAIERIVRTENLPAAAVGGVAEKDLPVISGRIPPGRKRQSRSTAAVAGVALASAGAVLGALMMLQGPTGAPTPGGTTDPLAMVQPVTPVEEPTTAHASSTSTDPAVTVQNHVAVFDFRNGREKAPDAAEWEWLEVGIPEMLIANLGQQEGVVVILRDDLVHQMHSKLKKSVDLSAGAPDENSRIELNEETRKLVAGLNARWVITGKFYAQQDLRIVANLYRAGADGTLQSDGKPIMVSGLASAVFALVDDLSAQLLRRISPQDLASNWDGLPGGTDRTPAKPEGYVSNASSNADPEGRMGTQSKTYLTNRFGRRQQVAQTTSKLDEADHQETVEPNSSNTPELEKIAQAEKLEKDRRSLLEDKIAVAGPVEQPRAPELGQSEAPNDESVKKVIESKVETVEHAAKTGSERAVEPGKSKEPGTLALDKDAQRPEGTPAAGEAADAGGATTTGDAAATEGQSRDRGTPKRDDRIGANKSGGAGTSGKPGDTEPTTADGLLAGAAGSAGGRVTNHDAGDAPPAGGDAPTSQDQCPHGPVVLVFEEEVDDLPPPTSDPVAVLPPGAASQVKLEEVLRREAQELRDAKPQAAGRLVRLRAKLKSREGKLGALVQQLATQLDRQGDAADDTVARFQISCTVRKHLEKLTEADADATRQTVQRLESILAEESDLDGVLERINGLLSETESSQQMAK